jgi:predicted cobalt transporter CbtA
MVRRLLIRGMLVGLVAGIAAFGFARWKGEPSVNKAIAYESYVEYNIHHQEPEAVKVSRSLQDSAGLGTGALIYGVAMGGIFALVFCGAYGRIGLRTVRGTAALMGALGFVAVGVVPMLKYPANPPAIGQADTIAKRTVLYSVMILLSVGSMVMAATARKRILPRFGHWNATLMAAAGYVVAMMIAYMALPGINEVPQQAIDGVTGAVTDSGVTFPPGVLWNFRVASLGIQLVMWAALGVGFGLAAQGLLEPGTARVRAARTIATPHPTS